MSKLNFLFFLLVTVFMVSCDPDKPVDPKPDPNSESCFEFKDLDALFRNVTKVHFLTPNDGWMVGVSKDNLAKKTLANTTDGGNTWAIVNEDLGVLYNNQIVPGDPIQFLDANTGLQLLDEYKEGQLKLAYTHDKGATWTRFPNPDIDHFPRFRQGFSSNSKYTMFVGDVSDDPFYLVINHQTMEIESYNVVRSDQDNLDQFQIFTKATGMHYSEDEVLTVVAQMQNPALGIYQMVAMQTTDKGHHWDIRKEFDFTEELAGSWVDDNVAFVFGKQWINNDYLYLLYKTLDGGLTWTKETVAQEFDSIDFLDADHGVGITSFHIYLTEDGGHTWTDKDCLVGKPYGTASYIGIDDIWANGVSGGVEGAFHYTGK